MLAAMAWRNLWRNRRRSLITLSAMVFGLFSCLVVFAIGDGAHLQMTRVATSTFLGHIQLNRKGFHKEQKLYQKFALNSAPIKLLDVAVGKGKKQYPWQREVAAWAPRLFGAGLVSTGKNSSGGLLLGLDLPRESRVTRLPESIVKAMAKEAIRKGTYKDRFPPAYLKDIRARMKRSMPAGKPTPAVRDKALRDALHEATKALFADRKRREKLLRGLLRRREAVIGRGLATVLKARVGARMAVVAQADQGRTGDDRYTVVGIFESGNADMDLSLCVVSLAQLQDQLYLDGHIHTAVLSLRSHKGSKIRSVAAALTATLQKQGFAAFDTPGAGVKFDPKNPNPKPAWEVLPWQRVSPELYEFIRADEAGQYLMTLIVFFLVAFVILNTLQMSILERTREFGVMRSLGMRGTRLVSLVLWEGLFLGLLATVLGVLLGLPVMAYLQATGIPLGDPLQMGGITLNLRLEGKITLQGLLFSPAVVILTTLIVSIFPAWRASRLKPVEALRHV